MKISFAVITALVLVGTAAGTRLGEGERKMLKKKCDDQKKYCCCGKDDNKYCVKDSRDEHDTEWHCKPHDYDLHNKEKLVEHDDDACKDEDKCDGSR
jgi:hypothetical protein